MFIISIILVIIVYSIGSYYQLKIISVCKKVKDKTWQIDITHSIALMISFFFVIVFEKVSDHVTILSQYTGVWFCYTAGFIYSFSAYLIGFHSFIIALMKYVFIVHSDQVRKFGDEKVKNIFFFVNIVHPIFLAVPTVLTLDLEVYSSLISCFGLQDQLIEKYNSSNGIIERMFLCRLTTDENEYSDSYTFYVFKQGFCAIKMIWFLLFSCNIPEGYLYFKIFQTMRR